MGKQNGPNEFANSMKKCKRVIDYVGSSFVKGASANQLYIASSRIDGESGLNGSIFISARVVRWETILVYVSPGVYYIGLDMSKMVDFQASGAFSFKDYTNCLLKSDDAGMSEYDKDKIRTIKGYLSLDQDKEYTLDEIKKAFLTTEDKLVRLEKGMKSRTEFYTYVFCNIMAKLNTKYVPMVYIDFNKKERITFNRNMPSGILKSKMSYGSKDDALDLVDYDWDQNISNLFYYVFTDSFNFRFIGYTIDGVSKNL